MSWMWFASLVVAAAVGMLLGILVMALLIAGNPASNPPQSPSPETLWEHVDRALHDLRPRANPPSTPLLQRGGGGISKGGEVGILPG